MGRGAVVAVAVAWAGALAAGCASDRSPAFEQRVEEASSFAEDRAVYRRYHGKYTGDPRLVAGMDRIEKALPAAEEMVRRRLGVPTLPFPPFAVCFVDGEGSGTDGSMETGLVTGSDAPVCVVAVVVEDLVTGVYDPESVLAHELTHVLHISSGAGEEAPLWLAEGVANWVELEDNASRADDLLSCLFSCCEPEVLLPEDESALEKCGEEQQSSAGAVFFFQLEWSRGTEAVQRLILRLLHEKDWKAVLRQETGRPLAPLFQEVRAGWLQWEERSFPGQEELDRIDSIVEKGKPAEALAALDAFIGAHPGDPRFPMWTSYRGHLLRLTGDLDGALAVLRALQRDHPRSFVAPISMSEELEVLREQRDWEGTAALARTLLRDFVWSAPEQQARKKIERTLEEAVSRIRSGDGGPGETRKRE